MIKEMLAKKFRLSQDADFKNVHRGGRRMAGRGWSITTKINNLDQPRFGVVISKKTAKLAVERNLAKRRTRAMIERLFKKEPRLAAASRDIIINITVVDFDLNQLEEALGDVS